MWEFKASPAVMIEASLKNYFLTKMYLKLDTLVAIVSMRYKSKIKQTMSQY